MSALKSLFSVSCLAGALLITNNTYGEAPDSSPVTLSIASNFKPALTALLNSDQLAHIDTEASFASSGKLTAQINYGAPFDIFLSADVIGDSVQAHLRVADTEFTYAFGQLALVSKAELMELSQAQHFDCVAIANPRLAPYGRAAEQAMTKLEKSGMSFKRTIRGQSVAQAFQFFDSGACESALVAFSLVLSSERPVNHIVIPQTYHQPIRQNAVLLRRAAHNANARQFLNVLQGPNARMLIRNSGYLTELP